MDFTCSIEGGEFTFNDFWEIRQCPNIELEDADIQLTLLTKLPHFNGYSLSPEEEAAIALKIQETVAELDHETNEFGSYIDKNFLEFWDTERSALRQQLLAQVVEAARELCRTGQFDPSLVLRAIRVCKEDPEWLSGYTRFVGGCIYQRANRLKQQINPDFGGLVKAGVGAEVQEDKTVSRSGKSGRRDHSKLHALQRPRPHDCRSAVTQFFVAISGVRVPRHTIRFDLALIENPCLTRKRSERHTWNSPGPASDVSGAARPRFGRSNNRLR